MYRENPTAPLSSSTDPTLAYRIVVPHSLKSTLLLQYHDSVYGAHLGKAKTYEKLKKKFYWEGMFHDIIDYISSCHQCSLRKSPHQRKDLPLGSIPLPSQPFETLGIDILGPLPITTTHCSYILLVTDHFTRWPLAFALKN